MQLLKVQRVSISETLTKDKPHFQQQIIWNKVESHLERNTITSYDLDNPWWLKKHQGTAWTKKKWIAY